MFLKCKNAECWYKMGKTEMYEVALFYVFFDGVIMLLVEVRGKKAMDTS